MKDLFSVNQGGLRCLARETLRRSSGFVCSRCPTQPEDLMFYSPRGDLRRGVNAVHYQPNGDSLALYIPPSWRRRHSLNHVALARWDRVCDPRRFMLPASSQVNVLG